MSEGWQPDPVGRHQERYHDGSGWTARVRDRGVENRDSSGLPDLGGLGGAARSAGAAPSAPGASKPVFGKIGGGSPSPAAPPVFAPVVPPGPPATPVGSRPAGSPAWGSAPPAPPLPPTPPGPPMVSSPPPAGGYSPGGSVPAAPMAAAGAPLGAAGMAGAAAGIGGKVGGGLSRNLVMIIVGIVAAGAVVAGAMYFVTNNNDNSTTNNTTNNNTTNNNPNGGGDGEEEPPERSAEAFCTTMKSEQERILALLDESQQPGTGDEFADALISLGGIMSTMTELQTYFKKLEQVAPSEIEVEAGIVAEKFDELLDVPDLDLGGALNMVWLMIEINTPLNTMNQFALDNCGQSI